MRIVLIVLFCWLFSSVFWGFVCAAALRFFSDRIVGNGWPKRNGIKGCMEFGLAKRKFTLCMFLPIVRVVFLYTIIHMGTHDAEEVRSDED